MLNFRFKLHEVMLKLCDATTLRIAKKCTKLDKKKNKIKIEKKSAKLNFFQTSNRYYAYLKNKSIS